MKIKNVKGIVWDLDGTLLDSFVIFERVIADVVKESGHTMPSNKYMTENYHGSLEETIERILGIKTPEELDKTLATFLEKQEHHYAGDLEIHLFKDATNLARQAAEQGVHQLLVTQRKHAVSGSASPKFIVAATFLADYIHEVYPADEVEFSKPHKSAMGDWIERHELSPDKVLVIGDQFVDAQLAINIGARVILVKRNGEIPHIDRFSEQEQESITIVDSLEHIELVK
jgi:phosphoglycolate phosphatase-like HAD superfamily hydrolase